MQKEEKQFIYYWYKEFGWKLDPFECRLLEPASRFIVGYEKERRKLNYFVIDKLPLVVINGKEGYGKTTLLLWLKEELSKYKGVVIVDYVSREIDFVKFIRTLLEPILTIKEKFAGIGSKLTSKSLSLIEDKNLVSIYEAIYFKKVELDLNKIRDLLASRLKGRPLVLIVDDFTSLDEKLILLLKILLESNINVQIAIGSEESVEKISKKEHIKLELQGLSLSECKEMITRRISYAGGYGTSPFTDEIFDNLYKKAKGSPLVFLDLCREKAVNLALNNLNMRKEEKLIEQKQTAQTVQATQSPTTEIKKEQSKPIGPEVTGGKKSYEIKVVNPKSSKGYNIISKEAKKKTAEPKKLEKKGMEPKRIK